MNAVKVLGLQFGLDINSENESEEEAVNQLPIVRLEKVEPIDPMRNRYLLMMNDLDDKTEVETYEPLAKQYKFIKEYNLKLKSFENGK